MSELAPQMGSRGDGVDPVQVVAPVIQNLTAQRLARAAWGLGAILLVAVMDTVLSVSGRTLSSVALVGALLAGGSLVAKGMVGVRRAFGDEHATWMTLAGLSFAAAHLYALWIFGYMGVRAAALAATGPLHLFIAGGYIAAGIRLMLDLGRISAVESLARFMSVPAPEEGSQ